MIAHSLTIGRALALWMYAPQRGLSHYLRTHYADKTFEHLYHGNAFDTALLLPYFFVMIVLSFYGIHRYQLVYRYYKNKANAAREPKSHFAELPRVTVQLPIFNEQFVVDRLIEACCNLDYPADKLEIQVLDDSTDGTVDVARAAVELYKSMGHDIVYLHRVNRYGFKAGALEEGLHVAKGEFVAIFDADFVPPRDWLMKVVHHFADPSIGMVQTRWTHINRDYSFLTQVEAILLDGHFVLEHGGRSRTNAFFNFNGTAGMWRSTAITGSGGWQHDTLTEDTDLSYRAQMKGWKFRYLQDVECPAELPVEMTAFKTQQARWAKGLIQTSKKILPVMFRSDASFHIKLESFYQVSQRELFPGKWYKTLLYLPFLMAMGIGLTITNSKAVIEALLGIKSSFKRTPKYRVEKRGQVVQAAKYRKRLGIVPWIELLIGSYFVLTIWYAIVNENFFTVPFLLLFVFGYLYTGFASLLEGRFDRFRAKADADEVSPKPFPVGV